jgi:hypothetical protein
LDSDSEVSSSRAEASVFCPDTDGSSSVFFVTLAILGNIKKGSEATNKSPEMKKSILLFKKNNSIIPNYNRDKPPASKKPPHQSPMNLASEMESNT